MRTFVVLICSLALACVAYAQPEQGKPQKKKQGQTAQHGPPPTGHPTGAGAGGKKPSAGAYSNKVGQPSTGTYGAQKGKHGQTTTGAYEVQKAQKSQTTMGTYQGQKGKKGHAPISTYEGQTSNVARGGKMAGKPFKAQHFNVSKQPNLAKAPAVQFQQGRHIEGSEHWQGQQYTAFRNYHAEWHDQGWWDNHYHNNIVFVFGAPYFFNAGYWYPAWGYYPSAYYAWDGPIYAYNHLPPDQVIANVQAALQEQGYYHGEVDGLIGPLTRAAIADYQRDHGLYETAAIDQPTLESLGMA